MAATLSESADLVQWPPFKRKVSAAMIGAAVAIGSEVVSSPPTETQRRRHALSANVLRDPAQWADNFAWAVATQASITFASNDTDIYNSVAGVWNSVAGVEPTA